MKKKQCDQDPCSGSILIMKSIKSYILQATYKMLFSLYVDAEEIFK